MGPISYPLQFSRTRFITEFSSSFLDSLSVRPLKCSSQQDSELILHGCRSLKDRVLKKKNSAGYRLFIDQNMAPRMLALILFYS